MQKRFDNRSIPAQQETTDHGFASSNSTSNHFLGATQRSWMTGTSRQPLARPLPEKNVRRNQGSSHRPSHLGVAEHSPTLGTAASRQTKPVSEDPWQPEPQLQPAEQYLQQPGSSIFPPSSSGSAPRNGITSQQASEDGLATNHTSHTQPVCLSMPVRTNPESLPLGESPAEPSPLLFQPNVHLIQSVSTTATSLPTAQGHWQSFGPAEPLRFAPVDAPLTMTGPANDSPVLPAHAPLSIPAFDPASTAQALTAATQSPKLSLGTTISALEIPLTTKRPRPLEADAATKRPRHSGTHTEQVPAPPSTPVSPMQPPYVKQLQLIVDRISQQTQINTTEARRITLLKQACAEADAFFLVLHQLYVLSSFQPSSVTRLGFGAAENAGLSALKPILIPNDHLSKALLQVFASFPTPPQSLFEPVMSHTVAQIKDFLVLFGMRWHLFASTCLQRRFPPCSEEILYWFGLSSSLMQKTLFSSLERQIFGNTSLPWEANTMRLFERTQTRWKSHVIQPGSTIEQMLPVVVPRFGHKYQNLLATHGSTQATLPSAFPVADQTGNLQISPMTHGNHLSAFPDQASTSNQVQYINPDYVGTSPLNLPSTVQTRTQSTPGLALLSPNQSHRNGMSQPQPWQSPSRPAAAPAQVINPTGLAVGTQNGVHALNSQSHDLSNVQPRSALSLRRSRPPKDAQTRQGIMASRQTALTRNASGNQHMAPGQRGTQLRPTAVLAPQQGVGPLQGQSLYNNQGFVPRAPPGFIPPPGYLMPQTTQPSLERIALHQSHLRSPAAIVHDLDGRPREERLYAYTESFALSPMRIDQRDKYIIWHFAISDAVFAAKARRLPSHPDVGVSCHRVYKSGCNLIRLKCTKRHAALPPPDLTEYSESSICWPSCAFVSLNDTEDVEFRRKSHWGRDLAADLTDLIRPGNNTLTLSYHGVPAEANEAFYFAVEIVRVSDHASTCALTQSLSEEKVLSDIIALLKISQDDEISFADPNISIDLIDPFTAKIWETPVRGTRCKHRECFDREAFLLSRTTRQKNGPTDPDRWTCPICSKDARPQHLLIDHFLVDARAQLEADGKLDARALIVTPDGTWEAKIEQSNNDGLLTGSDRVNKATSNPKSISVQPKTSSGLGHSVANADAPRANAAREQAQNTIIEIDGND